MEQYDEYLRYLKHVDDTTLQDFEEEKSKLQKDFEEEKSKLQKDFEEEKSKLQKDFEEEKSKLQKDFEEEKSKLQKDFEEEKSKLQKDFEEEKSKLQKERKKMTDEIEIYRADISKMTDQIKIYRADIDKIYNEKIKHKQLYDNVKAKFHLVSLVLIIAAIIIALIFYGINNRQNPELQTKVDFLDYGYIFPASGAKISSLQTMEISFNYNVQVVDGASAVAIYDAEGNEVKVTQEVRLKAGFSNVVEISFGRAVTLDDSKQYTIIIPAGTIQTLGDATNINPEICVNYIGLNPIANNKNTKLQKKAKESKRKQKDSKRRRTDGKSQQKPAEAKISPILESEYDDLPSSER